VKISLPIQLRRQQNVQLLISEVGGVANLSRLVGSPRPHLSAIASGAKPCGNKLAAKIEERLDKDPGWLDEEHRQGLPDAHQPGMAHVVSYPRIETPPITQWEVVVSLEKMPAIPADLMVEAPDDALKAAGLGKGQLIWFRAASAAQPANVVLIEAEGRRYIRRYTEDGTAAPLDSAYKTFTDFRVVAVMFMRPGSSV